MNVDRVTQSGYNFENSDIALFFGYTVYRVIFTGGNIKSSWDIALSFKYADYRVILFESNVENL